MTTDDLLRTALTIDDELDDIRRAQAWARLEPQLRRPAPAVRARWPFAFAGGLVAAAAAIAWFVHTPAAPASFVAPAETTLSLHVDDATRAVLVGPAELVPVSHSPSDTVVRLRRGTLLGEFEGGHGRSLHILAGGTVVEIVGTLFAVEVNGATACVSVSHGTVKMTTGARVQLVTNGQRACSDQVALAPIAPAMRDALVHHEATAVAATATATVPAPIVTPIEPPPAPEAAPPSVVEPPPAPEAAPPSVVEPPHHVEHATPPRPLQIAPTPAEATEPAPLPPAAPTPPAPTPAPAHVKQPPLDADGLYGEAERALAARDPVTAERDLAKLISEFPTSSLLDQAYFERARIAFDRGRWAIARHDLDKLAEIPTSPLAEPGAYLGCRIAVAAHDGGAIGCFTDYRTRYPQSPHDREALAAIVELAFKAGACVQAKPHIDELVARYPTSELATSWSAKCK